MRPSTALSILSATAASAMPTLEKRQEEAPAAAATVLIGQSMKITIADFDGSSFETVAELEDDELNPSWMAFKEPNHIYAVNEWANDTRHYTFDAESGEITLQEAVDGALGVVHLGFNSDKTRLVGTSYGDGSIDVWDISNSTLRLIKNVAPVVEETGPGETQETPTAHGSVLDPTGRYFIINDLGTDTLSIIDTQDDLFEIVDTVSVDPGLGPRHGVFLPTNQYALVTELGNTIELFDVTYPEEAEVGIALEHVQSVSTLGETAPPEDSSALGPFAGAIDISEDGQDIYVSNRLIGGSEDNIVHFTASPGCKNDGAAGLALKHTVSSAGVRPRMHSLSKDGSVLFSTNQDAGAAYIALARDTESGELSEEPLAVGPEVEDGEFTGPAFILQIA